MTDKQEEKHCDRCSYHSQEGLVITGCAYCGCHGESQSPQESDWEKELAKIAAELSFYQTDEKFDKLKSFYQNLLLTEKQKTVEDTLLKIIEWLNNHNPNNDSIAHSAVLAFVRKTLRNSLLTNK